LKAAGRLKKTRGNEFGATQPLLCFVAIKTPAAALLKHLTCIFTRSIGGESGIVLELHRACKRCVVTTYNPDTAVSDKNSQTLVILKSHRTAHPIEASGEKVGLFGQYAIHQNNGQIFLNQEIEVLEYKRQACQKHPLVSPSQFLPHALNGEYRSFRVLSTACDDPANPRPMHRLKLEVVRDALTAARVNVTMRPSHCAAGGYCGFKFAHRLAHQGVCACCSCTCLRFCPHKRSLFGAAPCASSVE